MPEFTDTETKVLAEYERLFWLSGEPPTLEQLALETQLDLPELKKSLGQDRFRLALRARGLPVPTPLGEKSGALSPEQLILANMILSAFDKSSVREKLNAFNKNRSKETQVTPQQLQAWQRTPAWISYVTSRAEAEFHGSTHLAFQAVRENVEEGDLSAAKLMLEITGKYNPRLQIDVDVNFLVARVLEAVQKHVKEPAILLAISKELEQAGVVPQLGQQAFQNQSYPATVEVEIPSLLDLNQETIDLGSF